LRFNGHSAHCREGRDDASAVLAHLQSVGKLLGDALKIAKIVRLDVHGPAGELDKLRGPMASPSARFHGLGPGPRRAAGAGTGRRHHAVILGGDGARPCDPASRRARGPEDHEQAFRA
jgi:hypothetical protein